MDKKKTPIAKLNKLIKSVMKEEIEGMFSKKPWESMLDVVVRAPVNLPFTITKDWAEGIIEEFNIKELVQGPGDMTGETSALFKYKGKTLRLKKAFPNRWQVSYGPWKSDPRWTGD